LLSSEFFQSSHFPLAQAGQVLYDGIPVMMDVLILIYIAFDPWRILLPLGLSGILVVSPWFTRGNDQSPYRLVERSLGLVTAQLAMGLFLFTGLFGIVLPWFPPSALEPAFGQARTVDMLESFCYLGGVYCLSRIKGPLAQGGEALKQWTIAGCLLFLLAGILWTWRWDAFAFGGLEGGGETVSAWDWTRIFPKTIHLLLSALATGGLPVMLIGYLPWKPIRNTATSSHEDQENEESWRIQIVRFGMAWVLVGVVPQVVVGSWLLVALGEEVRNHFLNGLTLGSVLFFSSLLVALLGLVLINAAFIAPYVKGLVWGGGASILVALFLMGFIRYESIGAGLSSLNTGIHWFPLNFWHLMFGVLPMVGLLFLLIRGLRIALIAQIEKPAASLDKSVNGN